MYVVRGTTPQDINKLNDFLTKLHSKVFSKIKFKDLDYTVQNKINTQIIPINGVGNMDSVEPYKIFFYVEPGKYKIVDCKISFLGIRYRTDVVTDTSLGGAYTGSSYSTYNGSGNIMTEPGGGGTVGVVDNMVTVENHRHNVTISSHRHSTNISIPKHSHALVKGIEHSSIPSRIDIDLNGTNIATLTSTTLEKNSINITDEVKEGWNIITCSATTLARIVAFGTLEVIIS